jgi:hypothetical protein
MARALCSRSSALTTAAADRTLLSHATLTSAKVWTSFFTASGRSSGGRVDWAADGIGYGPDHPVFWIDRFTRILSNGTPPWLPSGLRKQYAPSYYAAFVRDPDGNNIEAAYRGA